MPCCAPQRLLRDLRSVMLPFLVGSAIIATLAQHNSWAAELSRVAFSKFALRNCSASFSCAVGFGSVPGTFKRRYEITNVSCYLAIGNASGSLRYWYLSGTKSGQLGRIHLRPSLLGTSTTEVTYNANEQGLVVVPGGGEIIVTVAKDASTAGGINSLQCSIGGYDVTLD